MPGFVSENNYKGIMPSTVKDDHEDIKEVRDAIVVDNANHGPSKAGCGLGNRTRSKDCCKDQTTNNIIQLMTDEVDLVEDYNKKQQQLTANSGLFLG